MVYTLYWWLLVIWVNLKIIHISQKPETLSGHTFWDDSPKTNHDEPGLKGEQDSLVMKFAQNVMFTSDTLW